MFFYLDDQTRTEWMSHQLLSSFDGERLLEHTMDAKGKEKGILKLEPRPRTSAESTRVLTPQGSCDRPPCSPQPSVDRLSVTWADPGSMASPGVSLFHQSSDTPVNSEVKFSPSAGDGSDDEDYSASLSAVLRQRRASVRRSRKGRTRRPSSPFLPDEGRTRRRSSVFTTSSGDTAISIDEQPGIVTQEVIFENIHLHKEVLGSVKQQPLAMRRKLKIVHQAKTYVKRHEGQLQERLAQSKSTRDIYARFNILLATKWQQLKREAANTSNLLIPWELRIKEIESHFGSVVASYFTFLRWLFWVNLVIGFILLVFVIIPEVSKQIPEYLTANPLHAGERKKILDEELRNATNLLTLWEFEGVLKCSPIFYGYYSNIENSEYRMPLAYFLTGLAVYIYSFVAILRKMAENSRMSKLSEKEDECIFSWKLFTGWDFMIGNAETAHNRIASVILGFKEALLEEAEKKKNLRNWRIISLRAIVNICVVVLLAISAYAVVTVVSRSDVNTKPLNWWRENETTTVVTIISITFPVFFELLGYLEHYHPRKQLRLQLARIMLLNLLNLYSLIFALFSKIEGMSKELYSLQPNLSMNAVVESTSTINLSTSVPLTCLVTTVPCLPPEMATSRIINEHLFTKDSTMFPILDANETLNMSAKIVPTTKIHNRKARDISVAESLSERDVDVDLSTISSTTSFYSIVSKELEKLRAISKINILKNLSAIDELSTTNDSDEDDSPNYYEYETETIQNYDNNESNTINGIFENYSTVSVDTTTGYNSSEPTFNVMDSSDTTETTTSINNATYSVFTDSFSESSPTDSTYSDTTFTDEPKTTFTFIYSINSNSITTESTATNPINIKSSTPSSTNVNYIPTDDLSTSTKIYTPTESTEETSSIAYDYVFPTFNNITSSQSPILMKDVKSCPNITFNCSMNCGKHSITQIFYMVNCSVIDVKFYSNLESENLKRNVTNATIIDTAYVDNYNRKMYNLSVETKKKLLKLCWETMFGQELVKLTMMDLVFVLLGTLFMDFFRALFVRYMNRCWCWDLEKRFPEYGDFKIAENILHLINNQGMVWMGMFFSPGLVVLNVFKLMIMMYLRSWAVMTCNVPHEVVFRVSKSNNFYLALLLTMLFLCVLPVGYTIVWVKPSWHCGPFSEYEKIYYILTTNIYKILPKSLNFTLEYIASPAIVIPLLLLLILIIYYLTSLTNSLREANNDLKIQLRRERTEERRKMFQLADTRRRVGSSAMDSTSFARWKKALPSLRISKSIDSDDRKAVISADTKEPIKSVKKRGGFFAKIVGLAIDKKTNPGLPCEPSLSSNNLEGETDTDFHESLPEELLKIKDITVAKNVDQKKKSIVEFKYIQAFKREIGDPDFKLKSVNEALEKKDISEKNDLLEKVGHSLSKSKHTNENSLEDNDNFTRKINKKQTSETSNQSKQSDSISSVIPVITISTTESDDEVLHTSKPQEKQNVKKQATVATIDVTISQTGNKKTTRTNSDSKSLQRQNSVDSINESKKERKPDEDHKNQVSL